MPKKGWFIACVVLGISGAVVAVAALQTVWNPSGPTVEERLAAMVDSPHPGESRAERIQALESLLDEQPASATRGRICALLGEMYINTAIANIATLDDIDVARELKGQQYLLEALEHDWPIHEQLSLTDRLVQSMERTARRGEAADWAADRRQIGTAILTALNVASKAPSPEVANEIGEPSILVTKSDGTIFVERGVPILDSRAHASTYGMTPGEIESYRKLSQERRARIEEHNQAVQELHARANAAPYKDLLERDLISVYDADPSSLDELEELGRALVEDQAYFDRLYAQALEYALDPSKLNDR
jgi:hypothetical protein